LTSSTACGSWTAECLSGSRVKVSANVTTLMLVQTQALLGGAAEEQNLKFLLESICAEILDYCRREDMNEHMRLAAVKIAVSRYRSIQPGSAEAPQEVASISDADQSVSYRAAQQGGESTPSAGLTPGEKKSLNRHRKAW